MKTYYGTKIISAEPMTRKVYNDLRGWDMPPDEDGSDNGYIIVYPNQPSNVPGYDGYVSWSPKDVFDNAYKEIPSGLEPYQQRVAIEHSQLSERITGLESFIGTERFFALDANERSLQAEQLESMLWYQRVLDARIKKFNK